MDSKKHQGDEDNREKKKEKKMFKDKCLVEEINDYR